MSWILRQFYWNFNRYPKYKQILHEFVVKWTFFKTIWNSSQHETNNKLKIIIFNSIQFLKFEIFQDWIMSTAVKVLPFSVYVQVLWQLIWSAAFLKAKKNLQSASFLSQMSICTQLQLWELWDFPLIQLDTGNMLCAI